MGRCHSRTGLSRLVRLRERWVLFRGKFWLDHSTWTGDNNSIDGEQHHFIGSWSIFDPDNHKFSRLDIPIRNGEQRKYLMSDYCAVYDGHLFILAVNQRKPKNVIVLQSKPLT